MVHRFHKSSQRLLILEIIAFIPKTELNLHGLSEFREVTVVNRPMQKERGINIVLGIWLVKSR